jgi:hypothetical protein
MHRNKSCQDSEERWNIAYEKLSEYFWGDPTSEDRAERIKVMASKLKLAALPDLPGESFPSYRRYEETGQLDEPESHLNSKCWYDRIRSALKDRNSEFFKEIAEALALLRAAPQPRKPYNNTLFPYEELKDTLANVAFWMLGFWPKFPTRDDIIEATKKQFAWKKVLALDRKTMTPKDLENTSRSKAGIESRQRQVEELVKKMSDRKNGEIKWGQMFKELSIDVVWPVKIGRPRKQH